MPVVYSYKAGYHSGGMGVSMEGLSSSYGVHVSLLGWVAC